MKRTLALLLALVMVLPCGVYAAAQGEASLPQQQSAKDGAATADGLKYMIFGGKVIITDYTGSATEIVIPDTIDGYPVTSIGERAFYDCSSLTSITLPEGVTSIGDYAFGWCESLTSIRIPKGVTSIGSYAFDHCSSLTSFTLPESVTSIRDHAFCDCSSLTSITLPEGLTSIEYDAFRFCDSLTSITLPESVTSIGDGAFYYCDRLAEVINHSSLNITKGSEDHGYVAYYAEEVHSGQSKLLEQDGFVFYPVEGGYTLVAYQGEQIALTVPTLDKPCVSIRDYAFDSCDSLTSITLPNSLTSIGWAAFSYCSSLTSITLPDSVTAIGEWAFAGCSSLTSITLPEGLTSIGDYAFCGCSGLTSIRIPEGVTSIGDDAFGWCESLTDVYYLGTKAQWQAITIGEVNEKLTSATIHYLGEEDTAVVPEGLEYEISGGKVTITGYNGSATELVIPATIEGYPVTGIGKWAFSFCRSLTSITLPESVTSIGGSAFSGCDNLSDVYYLGTKAQWQAITIGGGNEELTSAVIHYLGEESGENTLIADANGDNSVNYADIQRIYQHLSTDNKLAGTGLGLADANKDGAVNYADIQRIYQHLSTDNKLF